MCRDSDHGDLSNWDVSRVTTMSVMVACAALFDGDISKWDVSRVTNMQCMFNNAKFLPVGDAVQPNAVVLADALTDAVLAALSQNATVVLVSGAGSEKTLIPTAPTSSIAAGG